MNFEQYQQMSSILSMYLTKLNNIFDKRNVATVMVDEEADISHYSNVNKTIVLKNDDDRSKYHEFGHYIYHQVCGKETIKLTELQEMACEYISWENPVEDAVAFLEISKEEYKIQKNSLILLSDFLGMIINERIPGYASHPKDYVYKHKADIIHNESFANFCGLIGTRNIQGLFFVFDNFPCFANSCLDLIDRAIRELKIVS